MSSGEDYYEAKQRAAADFGRKYGVSSEKLREQLEPKEVRRKPNRSERRRLEAQVRRRLKKGFCNTVVNGA